MTNVGKVKDISNINSQYEVEQSSNYINATNSAQNVNSVINPDEKISSNSKEGTYIETNASIDDEAYKSIIEDLQNKIEQKKQELSDTKNNRGWLSSIGNGISEAFGGGDKSKQSEIDALEKQLSSLEENPENISGVYKSIMGKDLDVKAISSLKESNTITKNLTTDQNKQIQEVLNQQYEELEAQFKDTKDKNGWISGGWDKFKNWTGIGASSNKTRSQLDNMKEQLKNLEDHPENLAQAYKNITDRDLNNEELTKLVNGEVSLSNSSKASESVGKYSEGQKMVTDVVADIISGIVAIGAIALAPFTGGASLLLAAGVGAAVKIGLKASDCIGTKKTYGLKDFAYDAVTGSINGALAPISNGLGGAVGTSVAKTFGLEAVETTAKTVMTQAVKTASKEVAEEAIEQTVKQGGKTLLTNVLAKQGSEYVLKEGTEATLKTVLGKTLAYGADMAVDGSLSGATDGFARALAEGRIEDIPQDILNGAVNGLIAAPIIGSGFRLAGKSGKVLNNKIFNKTEKEISENITKNVAENVTTPETKLSFGSITTSLKNSSDGALDDSITNKAIASSGENALPTSQSEKILSSTSDSNPILKSSSTDGFQANAAITDDIINSTSKSGSIITKDGKEIILATNPEYRFAQLKELGIKDDDIAQDIAKLDGKQYKRCVELLDKQVNDYNIQDIAGLNDIQYKRCVELLDKKVKDYNVQNIAEFDDKQYKRCIELLDKQVDDYHAVNIAKLDDKQYQRYVELFDKGINIYSAKDIAGFDDKQYKRCIELLDKKVNDYHAVNIAKLDDKQYQRYVELLDKDVDVYYAKYITELNDEQYKRCVDLLDKDVNVSNAKYIAGLNDEQYKRCIDLLDKNIDINDPIRIANEDINKYSQLLSLADDMKNVRMNDSDGKSRFLNCGELFKIFNDDYCKANIKKFISKGNIQPGEINQTIATGKLIKKYATLGKEQDFINYANSIDYEKLRAAAPDVDRFTTANFETLLEYHFKNGTTEFTQESLKYNGELSKLLTENLINATELSKILSAFPNTNRNIGSLPQNWVLNPSKEITTRIYNVIDNFNSFIKSNKIDLKTNPTEINNLATEFSKILGKKIKAEYLGAGSLGDAIKLEMDGAEPFVLKTFKTVPYEVRSDWENFHGAGNEPQAGIFAKEHNLTNFAEFYFGKVANSNDSDGFMVTKFLSEADNIAYSQTTADKLKLNYMHSLDNHSGNLINDIFIDYGAVKLRSDVSIETYDLTVNIVNKTMDYKNQLSIIENVNLGEYLNRLAKTPEIGKTRVLNALEFLNQNYKSNMSDELKNQLDDWIKKYNN